MRQQRVRTGEVSCEHRMPSVKQVIDVLKAAFVHGRLDKDAFDLRIERALASQTRAELTALIDDASAPHAPSVKRERSRATVQPSPQRPGADWAPAGDLVVHQAVYASPRRRRERLTSDAASVSSLSVKPRL